MPRILPSPRDARHLLSHEPQAKVPVNEIETAPQAGALTWKADIGQALAQAIRMRGWSLKEFSAAADRDVAQCSRWVSGHERAQLDVIMSIPSMRMPFVIAMAHLSEAAGDAVAITTHIQLTRRA